MTPSIDGPVHVVDPADFRRVVGHLASGVTVLTTSDGAVDAGMTASSVTSLSLDPPMMLACVNNAAPTAHAIKRNGRFAINILREGQEELAHQFAAPSRDKFRDVAVHRNSVDIPLLTDSLAQIECRVGETIIGGTHTVFLGVVTGAVAGQGQPLTYFRGGFGRFEFTHNDEVYEKARAQVLARCFSAEQVVTVDEMARLLGVERPAAFYALTRLAADGLVRRDPDRGYVIAPLDAAVSDETFDARLAIELGVIDLVVGHVSTDDLAELRRRFTRMADMLVDDRFVNFSLYLDANYNFHEWLVSLAKNPLLTTTFGRLSIKSVMTRSFGSTPESSQLFVAVQEQLTRAFEDGDAEAAKSAARRYCELAKRRAREILLDEGGRL
ncbi:flavin reductase [Mycolicibacterium sp.]|uniref:flavin reductase n=1 Tax=Mycolicibacterium sp. TaxID=2320850 RepID=UPI003D0DB33B